MSALLSKYDKAGVIQRLQSNQSYQMSPSQDDSVIQRLRSKQSNQMSPSQEQQRFPLLDSAAARLVKIPHDPSTGLDFIFKIGVHPLLNCRFLSKDQQHVNMDSIVIQKACFWQYFLLHIYLFYKMHFPL